MQLLPPIVKNIIIINVIFVFAQYVLGKQGIDLADYLGLHYWRSSYFRWWQPLTHIFMHGSASDLNLTILHIFSNMFGLWMFGSVLENTWGPKKFLTFYLICGVGAALCHMGVLTLEYEPVQRAFEAYKLSPTLDHFTTFGHQYISVKTGAMNELNTVYNNWMNDPGSQAYVQKSINAIHDYIYGFNSPGGHHEMGVFDEATVGASGAVFGVLFAFGYLFPDTLIYLYFFVPLKAKWFIILYAAFELYSGVKNSAGDNVAHFAHLGGMLFAFILLKIWQRQNNNRFRRYR